MSAYPQLPSIDESITIQAEPKKEDRIEAEMRSLFERIHIFTPGFLLQVFALLKFSFVLYYSINRPWNENEMPIVVFVLGLNTLLLVAATFQDFCSLMLTWIATLISLIFYTILLITVPIFVTSYFASDSARYVKIPQEWKLFRDMINYQSAEERRFNDGISNGLNVELGLAVLVFVIGFQMSLINGVLNTKIAQYQKKKQLKRDAVIV